MACYYWNKVACGSVHNMWTFCMHGCRNVKGATKAQCAEYLSPQCNAKYIFISLPWLNSLTDKAFSTKVY